MKAARRTLLALAFSGLALSTAAAQTTTETATTETTQPVTPKLTRPHIAAEVLFWSQAKREQGFPHMEDVFPVHTVDRGDRVHPLPVGKPLDVSVTVDDRTQTLDAYMAAQKAAGVLVIQDGKIRLEKYALGYGPTGRWTSFSVAKSFTSTLVGAAVKDGYIESLDDPIVRYIPGLKGSAYDGVTIRQVLTMTSGVKWNEDYTDPKSDVAQFYTVKPDPGMDATVSYMRKLPREAAPGTKWVYKTGETNLIGVLVTAATHKTLADYLSEKIWKPFGMEQDAVWMIDDRGQESGGCCLSVSLHDYGRMGLFMLGGAVAAGKPVTPDGWVTAATHKQADIGAPGQGYGYQWWTEDTGAYDAIGIFGQAIHIDPKRKLVVVLSSAWPHATGHDLSIARRALFDAVDKALDAERPPQP
jgi:CubicO group peptidase (beta-lactamase class C family)